MLKSQTKEACQVLCKYVRQIDAGSNCVRDMYSITDHRITLSEEVVALNLRDSLLTDEENSSMKRRVC